ncbi:MAG: TonB family protein [Rhodocyclaceae bacterium]|nr:TonB family protein [Rhodocyclaceae bacterium]
MAKSRMVQGLSALVSRVSAVPFPAINQAQHTLAWALAVSIVLHAILLMAHFSSPHRSALRRDSNLEVVLVNAKSANRPKDAQVLAQANLDAGGNTDDNRVASSPLPPTAQEKTGDTLMQRRRRVQELEARQRELLAQVKQVATPLPPRQTQKVTQTEPAVPTSGVDLAESALAMARLEAKISRDVNDYNKKPRVNHFGTRAATAVEAQYVEDWRLKVQRVGNLNYPEEARGKLYGNLLLSVEINSDGSLHSVEVSRSSGHKLLDEAAKRIVRLASPYGPFPAELKQSSDILSITRTWTFSGADKLQSD